jgi:hypothetical protein
MADLTVYVWRNIFKYVAIKAHYLFRQSTVLKTLVITRDDWRHYEDYHELRLTQSKTIECKIKKNNNFDYGKDTYFNDVEVILFYIGYRVVKESKKENENKDKKQIEIHMILNSNKMELNMNDIFKDVISIDFTANSSFNNFTILSNAELNKKIKIISKDTSKEYHTSLQYKLVESEYFDNPFYIWYDQFIPTMGLKGQLRHQN